MPPVRTPQYPSKWDAFCDLFPLLVPLYLIVAVAAVLIAAAVR